ncbi:MAG: hypothetical protein JEY99_19410 [Spirochaetales bacterium]|nr:hypothetical protein [Spirochaetales bacterium]
MKIFTDEKLNEALVLLESRIRILGDEPIEIVVCGGSALIATKLVPRTTKDVDIVALKGDSGLYDPDPMPQALIDAAIIVAKTLNLPEDWLNTGPADLFRMGLPENFERRLIERSYGTYLTVHFISRLDQIHFKLYASVDRGGYHIEDLLALAPSDNELLMAAKWTQTHDVSEGYIMLLKDMLMQIGYKNVASKL